MNNNGFCHNIIVDPVTCSATNQTAIDDLLKHNEECKHFLEEIPLKPEEKPQIESKKDDIIYINFLNCAENRFLSPKCLILCFVGMFICFFLTWIQSLLWGGEKYPNPIYSTPKRKIIEEIDSINTEINKLKIMMLTNSASNSLNGVFTDTQIDFFKNCGFKEGMKAKFSNITIIDYNSYQSKSYILAGIRRVNDPKFILAGIGRASQVFLSPYWNTLHLSLNLYWYFTQAYTFGFSIHSKVSLTNIDIWRSEDRELDNYKLSISQNGTAAGRVGNVFISEENGNLEDYEYVVMYLG